MPKLDPHALWLNGNGITFESCWPLGSNTNRKARVIAILYRIRRQTWNCNQCGDPLGLQKQADAKFCGDSCRKKWKSQKIHTLVKMNRLKKLAPGN